MTTVLIDYQSGNLHSAEKAFQRMAREGGLGEVVVTSDPDLVARAERIVLPGDGAFPSCLRGLKSFDGLYDAMAEAVTVRGVPFMGICIGMQMLATRGMEYEETPGFDWVPGTVEKIVPSDTSLKVPHMGWNDLVIDGAHPVLDGITSGDHAYFVHSYQLHVDRPEDRLAHVEYGGDVTAIVAKDTVIGLQFHPEKSQAPGLRMIANFLSWRP